MGGALILESLVLLHWCEKNGWGPLGLTGISMGGHMASLAATNWHKPLSLIPCLSWSTASSVFTQGVMQGAIDWKLLKHQYDSDNVYAQEITSKLEFQKMQNENSEKSEAFNFGRHFAKTFPSIIENSASPVAKNNQSSDLKHSQSVARDFMIGVMDECTHLANFSIPIDPELIIIVAATDDAYVPRRSVLGLDELWPGVEVRYVNSGHIGAFLFKQSVFRQAIVDSFQKQVIKYYEKSREEQN
ncbi:DgyrCDS7968 [Dimorphilus gyrociliatus]|uniref:DgyrCDS7968 n=1 Tax=Dimorphilus gyrociliatus TaxID=2664684 RepID=A0A7I8VSR6_9ANNE|nr:DgyrCDS7968 [Dimorphilus gyrociliatus]